MVIPAAGVGSRMGAEIPKQYLRINSKTILEHTIECFLTIDSIVGIVVVVSEEDPYWPSVALELSNNISNDLPIEVTTGGVSRADTVVNGLNHLRNKLNLPKKQWVMVHDAARPCVNHADLLSLLELCHSDYAGGILGSPVKDTMKRTKASGGLISHTESREKLWHALTPQLFRLGKLSDALELAWQSNVSITDEASAMEFIGASVAIVEGASNNIKLTTPSDLPLVEFLLNLKR